jgi:pimeloyl-ACP methyl ester carboxylesterase
VAKPGRHLCYQRVAFSTAQPEYTCARALTLAYSHLALLLFLIRFFCCFILKIVAFVESVLTSEPVYLVGNSLGGLLCASVASVRRDLVRGAVLLCPAPFWVYLSPRAPAVIRESLRALLRTFWARLTNASIILDTLSLVYACPEKIPPRTVDDILRPTISYAHAADVFLSVLSSPSLESGFEDTLRQAFTGTDALPLAVVYGREDPWVVPLFGLRVKLLVPACSWVELSPCGHCPHAEAPAAVNYIIDNWVRAVSNDNPPPVYNDDEIKFDGVAMSTRDLSRRRNVYEEYASVDNAVLVFLLAWISSLASGSANAPRGGNDA